MLQITDSENSIVFSKEHGIDLSFVKDNSEFTTFYDEDFPRKAFLDITTWKGITKGAMHYYGEIKISGLKAKSQDSSKTIYVDTSGPLEATPIKIKLTRPIRKRDLLIDKGERFKGAKIGERIKNFDTRKEVEDAAIRFFKKNFEEGWILTTFQVNNEDSNSATTNTEVTLAERGLVTQ
ncbi:MAG: hypothetical protein NE330_14390 [Lentisphaeraceae bacterium]|nr:hypothetical protein [Lentisphaeraceae bacterium]